MVRYGRAAQPHCSAGAHTFREDGPCCRARNVLLGLAGRCRIACTASPVGVWSRQQYWLHHRRCVILHVRLHMRIHVEGESNAAMSELLADDGRHSGGE